ncbi:MAG: FimB/Mfa2 family fimbrial subunit [Muribaculaceae bacterium]|nr:FimB/Mfa2 family fimbrial subunit [Muribaculaceae bacterium]
MRRNPIFPAKRRGSVVDWLLVILLSLVSTACSIDDPRDECCMRADAIRFTYLPYGQEEFGSYIFSMRHLLYDSAGYFLKEIPSRTDLQYLVPELEEGDYTLLSFGNENSGARLSHSADSHISELHLIQDRRHTDQISESYVPRDRESEIYENGDELYWGITRIRVDCEGMLSETGRSEISNGIVTPMNNIHCHLNVKVEWANVPTDVGDYVMELTGVATGYTLHPERAEDADGFIVPSSAYYGIHRRRVALKSRELSDEFITLRYSDDHIPVFRLYFEGRQVSPDIDLGKAFASWGWHPSATHVQKYSILIRLFSDGRADVYPIINASVEDWINGGTFS